ncbi:MAG: HAD hydrolase-like protein [Deltaproteobacteria bacterium]
MTPSSLVRIDWQSLETIFLDMDGTLLDRHFDDYFWETFVPKCYAAKHHLPVQEAQAILLAKYKAREKTLDWTDLDFWSETLGLDIPALKMKIQHLIQVHPFVTSFLSFCRKQHKKIYLVTNAHSKTLRLKIDKTALGKYFDRVICSQEIGCPKEDPIFWRYLDKVINYDPLTTLLADDTESVLLAAQKANIRWLIFVARPSSSIPPAFSKKFPSILYFRELIQ